MFGSARRRSPPLPDHLILELPHRDVRVAVRASMRAVRFTLRLGVGEPTVTAPAGARLVDLADFLDRHRGWLAERLARRPEQVPFADGALLPFRGEMHRIDHRPAARGTVWRETPGEGEPRLVVAGGADHLSRRLRDFFVRSARADFAPAVARHAARLRIEIPNPRLRIKDTRSRWGSCTAEGELSFSWRVVLAPPFVLDYLAAHEVAHLQEMNHSRAFWRLVRETCPEMDAGRRWLKLHGAGLHGYGPAT
ncbi:MAG: M48 family metallopeptidase [Hyphomicrobiales bacterium]|nr:M48 family metallopeptidase [Hyphomicrobiales bacterium]